MKIITKNPSKLSKNQLFPLVNNEVCGKSFDVTPNLSDFTTQKVENYILKFIRKHTALYSLVSCGVPEELKKLSYSLNNCNREINPYHLDLGDKVSVKEMKFDTKTTRHVSGLKKCASPWACPACSSSLSMARTDSVKILMKGKDYGRFYAMAVYTISHEPGEDLDFLMDCLIKGYRYLGMSKVYKRLKKHYGLRFNHRGLENMLSIKKGKKDFHPHLNILMDFDSKPDLEAIELTNMLFDVYSKYMSDKFDIYILPPYVDVVRRTVIGKSGEDINVDDFQIKGGVSVSYEFDNGYVTKYGLASEVVGSANKSGRYTEVEDIDNTKSSFHAFQVLDLIRLNHPRKFLLIKMFKEYVSAHKGKSLFRFAPKSKKYYQDTYNIDFDDRSDQEVIYDTEGKGNTIFEFEQLLWNTFSPNSLELANFLSLDKEDMLSFVYDLIESKQS